MNYKDLLAGLNYLHFTESYMTRVGLRKNAAKYIDKILGLVPRADCILDIGGNVGLYSCGFALAYPTSIIHSFEPHPRNFEQLKHNTAYFPNITCHNVAVWDEVTELTLSFPEDREKENTGLYSVFLQKNEQSVPVPTITLDQFCSEYGLQPNILKIDVEGAEKQVLMGAKTLLPTITCVVVEKGKRRPVEFPEHEEVESILKEHFTCKIDGVDQFWVNHSHL
jgi:FkbM family methyltransferase